MTAADKIKALPFPEPSFAYERHPGGFSEPERVGAYAAAQMRTLIDAAADIAARQDAVMAQMVEALNRLLSVQGADDVSVTRMRRYIEEGDAYWIAIQASRDALRAHKEME